MSMTQFTLNTLLGTIPLTAGIYFTTFYGTHGAIFAGLLYLTLMLTISVYAELSSKTEKAKK